MSNIPQLDLNKILDEVETELTNLVKSDLAKARPGENTPAEDESDASTTDPTGENTSSASESPDPASASPDAGGSESAPPADDGSAPPAGMDDGSAPADASADPAAAGGDPAADQGPVDPQALMAEYAKLSPEDQKLHYMALKQVLMQTLAGGSADPGASAAPPGPDAGAPPPGPDASAAAPPPPAPPAPDASAPAPALKGEKGMTEHEEANGENPLHKTEAEFNAAVEAKVQAAVGPLVKAVQLVLERPLRKSITSVTELPAAAPQVDVSTMSREQVRAKLSDKVKTGTLSKSDKSLVIDFDTGRVQADKVAHLLK